MKKGKFKSKEKREEEQVAKNFLPFCSSFFHPSSLILAFWRYSNNEQHN